jgi:hypothetical protein
VERILKKTLLFIFFSGLVVFLAIHFNISSNFRLWVEIGLWMLAIFVLTLLIPYVFQKPVWPHLYKSTFRLLGSASFFVYLFFFKYPSEKACAWMICVYYFLFIFTELSIEFYRTLRLKLRGEKN